MDSAVAASYKSPSQVARVVTEAWCAASLYCARCPADRLLRTPPNTPATDLKCSDCGSGYEVKSMRRLAKDRVPDAGYDAMLRAIRANAAPNLFVLHYDHDWRVQNLLLVPSFFFSEGAIEPRKPLQGAARRAGWVGCNIRLTAIAPEGRLKIVENGKVVDPALVRAEYARVQPLSDVRPYSRGWTLEVLRAIHDLGKIEFTLSDAYKAERRLTKLFPNNRHIRPKIRQQLQVLRDLKLLEFINRGQYRLSARKA
ncbi:MAG TPA: DpnI domain-containing protein [Pirellulales bacterium]|nr:DpnI domain-containing protein [Pirellulales bacterium]